MSEYVKHCKIHGALTIDQVRVESSGKGKGRYYRCFACRQLTSQKQYAKNFARKIEVVREWKKANRELINARVREDRVNSPEKYKKWHDTYRDKNKETIERRNMAHRFGVTVDEVNALLDSSDGLCHICGNPETRIMGKRVKRPARLCIDHCHTTQKIRGLLCHACNAAIGFLKDDIEIMKRAIEYVSKGGR